MPKPSSTQPPSKSADSAGHVQIYTRTAVIAGLKDHLAQMPFPVVVDHFGRGNPGQGPGQADFVALLDLVKSGRVM